MVEDAVEVLVTVGLDDVVGFLVVVVVMVSWDVNLVDEMVVFLVLLLVGCDETAFVVVEVG